MERAHLSLSRRAFIALAAGAAAGSRGLVNATAAEPGQTIDAGPVAAFAKEGVYDAFRDLGFFVVRRGESLFALSFHLHSSVRGIEGAARLFLLLPAPWVGLFSHGEGDRRPRPARPAGSRHLGEQSWSSVGHRFLRLNVPG